MRDISRYVCGIWVVCTRHVHGGMCAVYGWYVRDMWVVVHDHLAQDRHAHVCMWGGIWVVCERHVRGGGGIYMNRTDCLERG